MNTFDKLSKFAKKEARADLVLKNANIINVFSEEIQIADVAISDGIIVGIGSFDGKQELDCSDEYVCPGFIDGHLHMESSLVTPRELVSAAGKCGTTTFIVNPNGAVNVSGVDGLDFMLEQSVGCHANIFTMLPFGGVSCGNKNNCEHLTAHQMEKYVNFPNVIGLAEVMDFDALKNGDSDISDVLKLFNGRNIDGHAPLFDESMLQLCALAGITSDHEAVDFQYAMKELRQGFHVLIREGSASRSLDAIVSGIVKSNINTTGFSFCTDDKNIQDIKKKGHINYMVRRSVELGLPVIKAVQMATINTARHYGIKGLGAIAVGYQADFILLGDLEEMEVISVFHKGIDIVNAPETPVVFKEKLLHTVNINQNYTNYLDLTVKDENNIIEVLGDQIMTRHVIDKLPNINGIFKPNKVYSKLMVIERHNGEESVDISAVSGFNIQGGAIASSISHDPNNIIVVGDNDDDIIMAVEEIISMQGGIAISINGEIECSFGLPVMGLMSDQTADKVNSKLKKLKVIAMGLGIPKNVDPFLTMSFLSLAVFPETRLTNRVLYDTKFKKII